MNYNTMDDKFWSNYDIQNTILQNVFFLDITIKYNLTINNKFAYYIFSLSGEAYI